MIPMKTAEEEQQGNKEGGAQPLLSPGGTMREGGGVAAYGSREGSVGTCLTLAGRRTQG